MRLVKVYPYPAGATQFPLQYQVANELPNEVVHQLAKDAAAAAGDPEFEYYETELNNFLLRTGLFKEFAQVQDIFLGDSQ